MRDPLVHADLDLRDFAFMPVDVRRLLTSETWLTATGDEKAAAMTLWLESWHQVPAGSLPDNDKMLSILSQAGAKWPRVRGAALRGWIKCTDGRLYHPVVCEKALNAWTRHHRLRHAAIRKHNSKRIKGARWTVIRDRILQRDGHVCASCRTTESPFEIDHIVPLAEGGSHEDGNLQVLCRPCNRRKSYKLVKSA